ncbi:acyl-CoA dehydrogenase [Piscirickettsia salmonis]|uniref:acyl-CoA dehydrogenase n=1 Tax=Piscirickettsia salmonis TaxID=1238 RepID=UPI0012BAFDA4|nr:acyl-CoA dehydrogenase [Piscirickettsia salmonis]QGP39643.1 Acyl-coenzyme A dehydrogenase [Piscirickettsia salmonis]
MIEIIITLILMTFIVGFFNPRMIVWSIAGAILLVIWSYLGISSVLIKTFIWVAFLAIAVIYTFRPIRRRFISSAILKIFKKSLPTVSQTEEEALNAGDSWFEADIFRGQPNWQKLQTLTISKMSTEEQAFFDNETEQLCQMIDDWQATHEDKDLSPKVWQFMKDQGFFGLVIDKKYGGKGFSAYAHSSIVMKVASKSSSAGVTVMVPNSLGPGELLYHYGTDEQKNKFLPELAQGRQIPCFALTAPEAGSDAASIPDKGIVCMGHYQGEETLGIRLTFNKRYITLAPVATLVGLAFHLYDPERLLDGEEAIGITCALMPHDHPGVNIGNRGIPLDMCFMNGTVRGEDVFIPIDWIIGGRARAGQGWKMLVECLSIGRSISLPACATATGALSFVMTGAYALVREQFNTSIGHFEGVEEALARIGGLTYLLDACRRLTVTAVDQGIKPSVASAIAKYHMTEMSRQVINDAMDIHGGRGILLGPRNYLGRAYQSVPIGITVEGANILTRNLILFGQGAMCTHPYLRKEFYAARDGKLAEFDQALFSHGGYLFKNFCRSLWHGLTAGKLIAVPESRLAGYYQQISRMSATFALTADVALLYLGGSLKRKERLSARLGDVMSYLYMASSALKRYTDEGEPQQECIYVEWAVQHCLYQVQVAFDEFYQNFPQRFLASVLRRLTFFWGKPYKMPQDYLDHKIAQDMLKNTEVRRRFAALVYVPEHMPDDAVGRVECAFQLRLEAAAILAKVKQAVKAGEIAKGALKGQIEQLSQRGALSAQELALLKRYEHARWEVIQVDEFSKESLQNNKTRPS